MITVCPPPPPRLDRVKEAQWNPKEAKTPKGSLDALQMSTAKLQLYYYKKNVL